MPNASTLYDVPFCSLIGHYVCGETYFLYANMGKVAAREFAPYVPRTQPSTQTTRKWRRTLQKLRRKVPFQDKPIFRREDRQHYFILIFLSVLTNSQRYTKMIEDRWLIIMRPVHPACKTKTKEGPERFSLSLGVCSFIYIFICCAIFLASEGATWCRGFRRGEAGGGGGKGRSREGGGCTMGVAPR